MSGALLEGRPEGSPDAEPLVLFIDPGSSTAEEVAKILIDISELACLMTGRPLVWTTPNEARNKLRGRSGVHWSSNEDDARCDLDSYGGWLLKTHDREFVVVEDEHTGLLIRTQEQLDDLEKNHDWSEVPR